MTAESVIAVSGLRKLYGEMAAVDGVSFDVQRGEIFGLIGPNGSGKTTTVECLQGLRTIDGGHAEVLGLDPTTEGAKLRHLIGSQLQESALPDRIRVWEALDLFSAMTPHGVPWQGLVEEWDLLDKKDAAFASLSGGQRQRLFIALSLVNNPRVVFLDEMTTGLDPAARRMAWDLVRKVRDRGATVVLVTHFMDEAEHLCDRIAVFRGGRIRAIDSPGNLIHEFGTGAVVKFTAPDATPLPFLAGIPGVSEVRQDGAAWTLEGKGAILAHTGAALVTNGLEPLDLRVERPTLEDVFLRLTTEEDHE
ncbi:MAG: ATP-binding cassette domain-containing protein [Dehalococcoidia bacterium]